MSESNRLFPSSQHPESATRHAATATPCANRYGSIELPGCPEDTDSPDDLLSGDLSGMKLVFVSRPITFADRPGCETGCYLDLPNETVYVWTGHLAAIGFEAAFRKGFDAGVASERGYLGVARPSAGK